MIVVNRNVVEWIKNLVSESILDLDLDLDLCQNRNLNLDLDSSLIPSETRYSKKQDLRLMSFNLPLKIF